MIVFGADIPFLELLLILNVMSLAYMLISLYLIMKLRELQKQLSEEIARK